MGVKADLAALNVMAGLWPLRPRSLHADFCAGERLPSLFVQLPFCGYNDKEQSGKELPL